VGGQNKASCLVYPKDQQALANRKSFLISLATERPKFRPSETKPPLTVTPLVEPATFDVAETTSYLTLYAKQSCRTLCLEDDFRREKSDWAKDSR